jgi:hypothetical protein
MVRNSTRAGADVKNRGIGQARFNFRRRVPVACRHHYLGDSPSNEPHGSNNAVGNDYVRMTVASFLNHSALAALMLAGIAGWFLFPARRLRKPLRDWLLIAVIGLLTTTSVYQLIWLQTAVVD